MSVVQLGQKAEEKVTAPVLPLWRIESEGSPQLRFVIGQDAGPEFTTVMALGDSPVPGGTLWIRIDAEKQLAHEPFEISELRKGEIFVPGQGYFTEPEFWARDTCT